MTRILSALLLLALLTGLLCSGAAAEEEILIDRITQPDARPDFAFPEGSELCAVYYPQILDVDAALILCGGEAVMIDVGSRKYSNRVIAMLEQLGITELDSVICSHPHYDHIEGLEELAKAVRIDELKISFPEDINEHMRTAMDVCRRYDIRVTHYGDGDTLTVGDAKLEVMQLEDGLDMNGQSAQIRLVYGERTQMFSADMTQKGSAVLVQKYPAEKLRSDILKYPHHGLKELRKDYVEAIRPLFAVITNNGGKRCKYSRISCEYNGIAYAYTVPGFVRTVTDGKVWLVDRLEPDKNLGDPSREDTRIFD